MNEDERSEAIKALLDYEKFRTWLEAVIAKYGPDVTVGHTSRGDAGPLHRYITSNLKLPKDQVFVTHISVKASAWMASRTYCDLPVWAMDFEDSMLMLIRGEYITAQQCLDIVRRHPPHVEEGRVQAEAAVNARQDQVGRKR